MADLGQTDSSQVLLHWFTHLVYLLCQWSFIFPRLGKGGEENKCIKVCRDILLCIILKFTSYSWIKDSYRQSGNAEKHYQWNPPCLVPFLPQTHPPCTLTPASCPLHHPHFLTRWLVCSSHVCLSRILKHMPVLPLIFVFSLNLLGWH